MTSRTTIAPSAKPGDHIEIESERVGQKPRRGEILNVIESALGPSFDVRWDDGHESSIRPAAGSARIIPLVAPTKRSRA